MQQQQHHQQQDHQQQQQNLHKASKLTDQTTVNMNYQPQPAYAMGPMMHPAPPNQHSSQHQQKLSRDQRSIMKSGLNANDAAHLNAIDSQNGLPHFTGYDINCMHSKPDSNTKFTSACRFIHQHKYLFFLSSLN